MHPLLTPLLGYEPGRSVERPMANPFEQGPPADLARAAATALQTEFRRGRIADGVDCARLESTDGGNMFGVLVVRCADGRPAFLRAFAGTIDGRTELSGFVPRLFDDTARLGVATAAAAMLTVANARGERRSLAELFAGREVPPGAGDCAAPKLLAAAYRLGLKPLALAEFWWGAPPVGGGRISGVHYPACRGRCGPLLPFMLEGVHCTSVGQFRPPASEHLEIRIVYEDEHIVVIDKPAGLLSVPSSDRAITDSAGKRLRELYPWAPGAVFVHRLDMDTSGLLVAALNPDAHRRLQRQFAKRTIGKRYVAVVDGDVAGDEGEIDLAIAVDIHDRPRHIHDAARGRQASTRWQVIERTDDGTRLHLYPLTGRTHQLRVHASHRLGLDAPIVGDRLYGRGGERLLLHAERLELRHPKHDGLLTFESPAPF